MDIPTPARAEQLLLAYLHQSTRHPGVQAADTRVSLADLATQAGVGRESCRASLHALVASGSAKVAVHEGGLLEIRVQARCPADVASFGNYAGEDGYCGVHRLVDEQEPTTAPEPSCER